MNGIRGQIMNTEAWVNRIKENKDSIYYDLIAPYPCYDYTGLPFCQYACGVIQLVDVDLFCGFTCDQVEVVDEQNCNAGRVATPCMYMVRKLFKQND